MFQGHRLWHGNQQIKLVPWPQITGSMYSGFCGTIKELFSLFWVMATVLLKSYATTTISINGSAAFIESCAVMGTRACTPSIPILPEYFIHWHHDVRDCMYMANLATKWWMELLFSYNEYNAGSLNTCHKYINIYISLAIMNKLEVVEKCLY